MDTKATVAMQFENFNSLPWVVAAIVANVAAGLLAIWWWRGMGKSGRGGGGKGTRKALPHTPGVRVVCVQVCASEE